MRQIVLNATKIEPCPVHNEFDGNEHANKGSPVQDAQNPAAKKKEPKKEIYVQIIIEEGFASFFPLREKCQHDGAHDAHHDDKRN
ncbi:MAG: hypothetical protein MZU95_11085 [Desulfomicrobium escambiense]|nr:hypothetical protein [Desulfomicrobium escambiense]